MDIKSEFFSDRNTNIIREIICAEILKKTGIKIPLQQKESVYIIMRYCFTNYSLNSCDLQEIEYLNKKTMDILIPNVMSNIEQYIKYIKCIDSINNPQTENLKILDYPQQTTLKRSEKNELFDYSVEFNNSMETIFYH